MDRHKLHRRMPLVWLAICACPLLLISATAARQEPVSPEGRLQPGTYVGTIIFTVEHTYNQKSEIMPMNYFSLRAEDVMGTVRFTVHEDGYVPGMSLRIPPFRYTVASSQEIVVPEGSQGPYHCTGNNAYGGGMATVSGGSGPPGAPSLTVKGGDIRSAHVTFDAGDPWGRVSEIGNCPPSPGPKSFITGIQGDFNSTLKSSFELYVDWQGPLSMGGSCSTAGWTTTDRSITCYWAAHSGGYRRLTAPGPG